jgi:hypothetical protein
VRREELRSGLAELTDAPLPTWTSHGLQDRATPLARRTARALDFLSELLGVRPDVQLLVLGQADWPSRSAHPLFGMPNSSRDTLVVAGEESTFWLSFVEILDARAQDELRAAYAGAGGGLDLAPFFDLLAIHELAHTIQWAGGVDFPRLWLYEFFCNVCLHAYVAEIEPESLPALTIFPRLVAAVSGERLPHRTLDEFERLYVDMPGTNYGWWQCRLQVAAGELFDAAGRRGVQRLWSAFRVDDSQLLTTLEEAVHPHLATIARRLAT